MAYANHAYASLIDDLFVTVRGPSMGMSASKRARCYVLAAALARVQRAQTDCAAMFMQLFLPHVIFIGAHRKFPSLDAPNQSRYNEPMVTAIVEQSEQKGM